MNTRHAHKLGDFPSGWHRHKQDEGIVFTSQLDIFRVAANDASCRAAILSIEENKKAADRHAFKEMWENSAHNKPYPAALCHTPQRGIIASEHGGQDFLMNTLGFQAGPAKQPLESMIELYQSMIDPRTDRTLIEIYKNWRTNDDDEKHDPHPAKILNRIFFSGGTILPLSAAGEIQVPEGDYLFMKPWCEHMPERLTKENQGQERLTVSVYSP
ncbi:MAG: hypothetical protein AB8B83_06910 [Bdellovibrionales bacterium]